MENLTLVSYGIATGCLIILVYTYFIAFIKEKNKRRRISVLSFLLFFFSSLMVSGAIMMAQLSESGLRLPYSECRGLFQALTTVFLLYTSLKQNPKELKK